MAEVIRWPRHLRANCPEDVSGLPQCLSGDCVHLNLFACRTCGGAEGELPTDCPGERMSSNQREAVYDGDLNYTRRGGWVRPEDRMWVRAW